MRRHWIPALFLTLALPGFSQTAMTPEPVTPKEPAAILTAASHFYDFKSPELKPWHLKATYQLHDAYGVPTEQGIFEYWWVSPEIHRSSWTRPGAMRTDWFTAAGKHQSKTSGGSLRYFESDLSAMLFSPFPSRVDLDSGRMKLELKEVPAGSEKVECVISSPQREVGGKLQLLDLGQAEYYCFDSSTLTLRVHRSGSITEEYSQIVKTQGRYLARKILVSVGEETLFTASVDTIDWLKPDDEALTPSADASQEEEAAAEQSAASIPAGGGVKFGKVLTMTQPIYPIGAKAAHIQGDVLLSAVIGTDGRIRDLEVLASPSPLLTDSAIDAVKQWTYRPYELNGKPVEVNTTIVVRFRLGN